MGERRKEWVLSWQTSDCLQTISSQHQFLHLEAAPTEISMFEILPYSAVSMEAELIFNDEISRKTWEINDIEALFTMRTNAFVGPLAAAKNGRAYVTGAALPKMATSLGSTYGLRCSVSQMIPYIYSLLWFTFIRLSEAPLISQVLLLLSEVKIPVDFRVFDSTECFETDPMI